MYVGQIYEKPSNYRPRYSTQKDKNTCQKDTYTLPPILI